MSLIDGLHHLLVEARVGFVDWLQVGDEVVDALGQFIELSDVKFVVDFAKNAE